MRNKNTTICGQEPVCNQYLQVGHAYTFKHKFRGIVTGELRSYDGEFLQIKPLNGSRIYISKGLVINFLTS